MRRLRQLGGGLVGLAVLWLLALVLIGWLGDGCARRRAEARIAGSLNAEVSIGSLDLGLVRGDAAVRDLRIERERLGLFRLGIDELDVDFDPLGLVLVQDDVGAIRARGVDLEITGLAALAMEGERKKEPVTFQRLELEDVRVTLAATRLIPGLDVALVIEHAVAGPTTLRTGMSWVFSLESLVARLDLPAGLTVRLRYRDGAIELSGGLFGATPVRFPVVIPVLEPARELEQLGALAGQIAGELSAQLLERWLRQQMLTP